MATLLLSDLHLPAEPSALREGFLRFLAGPARNAEAVYILGDLFEYWAGDDAGLRDFPEVVAAIRALTASGVPVWLQHGNRDFLVSADFCAASGARLLPDPVVVPIGGEQTLLSHGDLMCTDDHTYQRWRRFSRNGLVQKLFRCLPLSRRERIVGGIRRNSDRQKQYKAADIMDVNQRAVALTMARHGVMRLIHGHTHRPNEHAVALPSGQGRRIVLADWRPGLMEYVEADTSGLRRIRLQ